MFFQQTVVVQSSTTKTNGGSVTILSQPRNPRKIKTNTQNNQQEGVDIIELDENDDENIIDIQTEFISRASKNYSYSHVRL